MTSTQKRYPPARHILAAIIGITGAVLLWRAIWELSAEIFSPFTSLVIGLVLIAIVSFIEKDFLKRIF